MTTLGDEHTVD